MCVAPRWAHKWFTWGNVSVSVCVCVCVCVCLWVCVVVDVGDFHLMNQHNLVLPSNFLCWSILTGNTMGVTKLIRPLKIQ